MNEKIIFVLSLFEKATADQVAMEIAELQGIASEESMAELTIAVNEALHQMQHEGVLKMETAPDKLVRYSLKH
jgi:hypothetical protein